MTSEPEEEQFLSEKVELKPKEKINILIMDSFCQKQYDEFESIDLKPENLKEFIAKVKQAATDNILALNEIQNDKIDCFQINPDYGRFFKKFIEDEEKEKRKEHQFEWHGFTRLDWKENNGMLMKLEAKFQPRNALLLNLLLTSLEKITNYVFSPIPSMQKVVTMPSFGKGRGEQAYEMYKEGKTSREIADRLGIRVENVRAYVVRGGEKAKDPEFLIKEKAEKNVKIM